MISILKTIFGAPGIIENGIKLIDDLHTSNEEEIAAKNEAKIKLMNAYAPFKVAQRYLAVLFTVTYILSYLSVLIMTVMSIGNPSSITVIMEQFNINWIMGTIVLFYFGGGLAESVGVGFKTAKR